MKLQSTYFVTETVSWAYGDNQQSGWDSEKKKYPVTIFKLNIRVTAKHHLKHKLQKVMELQSEYFVTEASWVWFWKIIPQVTIFKLNIRGTKKHHLKHKLQRGYEK